MERRNALALAGSLAICVTAAGTAMAANIGLLQSAGAPGQVGQLTVQKVAAVAPLDRPPQRPAPSAAKVEAEKPSPQPISPDAPDSERRRRPAAGLPTRSRPGPRGGLVKGPSPEVWNEPHPGDPTGVPGREEVEHESTPVTTTPVDHKN
jgi:hypothetical protein